MIGGFTGVTIARETNSYLLGMLGGGAASGAVALLMKRFFFAASISKSYSRFYCFLVDLHSCKPGALGVGAATSRIASPPRLFSGSIAVAGVPLPVYRLVLIGAGIIAFVILWWLQEKTRFGAIVRAGMDDAGMVSALGIRLRPITAGAFCFALALAGVAAVMASPVLGGISLWTSSNILFLSFGCLHYWRGRKGAGHFGWFSSTRRPVRMGRHIFPGPPRNCNLHCPCHCPDLET